MAPKIPVRNETLVLECTAKFYLIGMTGFEKNCALKYAFFTSLQIQGGVFESEANLDETYFKKQIVFSIFLFLYIFN